MSSSRRISLWLILLGWLGAAWANDQKWTFDIPAQALGSALRMAGDQGQLKTFVPDDAVAGKQTGGIHGQYSRQEAIAKLLEGTGLSAHFIADDALTLKAGKADPATTLPKVKVTGKALYDSTDPYNPDYTRPTTATATKTNTPVMETPASIQVIPRQVMEDKQVTEISEAVNSVSGVVAADERQGGVPAFWIRGFLTNNYYLNGARMPSSPTDTNQNMANVERVEILKGPASILYGRGDPGGLVNLIPKQPLDTPYHSIQQQFGSWSFYRTLVDSTGPIFADNSLLYRVNFSYEDHNNFMGHAHADDVFFAPTIKWNIDDKTYANFFVTYQHRSNQLATAVPAFTGPGPSSQDPIYAQLFGTHGAPMNLVPRSNNVNQPWTLAHNDEVIAGFNWSHDFNDNWNLKHRFQTQFTEFDHLYGGPAAWSATGGVPTFQLDNYASWTPSISTQSYFTSLDLTGKFATAGVEHTLLAGTDFQEFDSRGHQFYDFAVPPTNIFRPRYYPKSSLSFDPASRYDFGYHESWWGLYLQDQVKLPYDFFLLAGGRYDDLRLYDDIGKNIVSDSQRITPRFGLLWRPLSAVSVYGSYLTNYGNSPYSSRNPVRPESGQQWEVGVKTELFDKRLTATFAYYELTKKNMAASDPTDPTFTNMIAIGQARSRGYELDVAGEILPGLRLIGGYSYIDSLITKDVGNINDAFTGALLSTVGNQGKHVAGVPRHSGSLWSTYELQEGDLRGLKFGTGVTARSSVAGDNFNDFRLPGYVTLGLMAAYTTQVFKSKATFQFNVDNLLDTRYYATSFSTPFAAFIGTPRSFLGSVKLEF